MWNEKHIEMLTQYRVKNPKVENLMLLVQKGDELLDYKESVDYLAHATQVVEEGGNHGFEGIDRHLGSISTFLDASMTRRRLSYISKNVNLETLAYLEEEYENSTLLEFLDFWPRHMGRDSPEYHYLLDEMLDKNPNLEVFDEEYGHTALHIACKEGLDFVVKKLLISGANPNSKDMNGRQPLEYLVNYAWRARSENYLGIYYLLNARADVDNLGENEESQTALGWACIYGGGTLSVVIRLLESGANPNKKNHQGLTPLMLASKSDRKDLVMILLYFGANIDDKDSNGITALDHAKSDKREDVVVFLEQYQ